MEVREGGVVDKSSFKIFDAGTWKLQITVSGILTFSLYSSRSRDKDAR